MEVAVVIVIYSKAYNLFIIFGDSSHELMRMITRGRLASELLLARLHVV